jgi:hypothetical protein
MVEKPPCGGYMFGLDSGFFYLLCDFEPVDLRFLIPSQFNSHNSIYFQWLLRAVSNVI